MAAELGEKSSEATVSKGRIWRTIGVFYALAVLLTLPVEWLVHHGEGNGARLLTVAVMWCPAIAAVLTKRLFAGDVADFGWRWAPSKYIGGALVIPLLYIVPAYLSVWLLGLGDFYDADFAAKSAREFGFSALPVPAGFVGYLMFMCTAGLVLSAARALGEEIGWRGFLVPQLARVTNFTGVGLISGLMWSAWHYPSILLGSYGSGTPIWYGVTCFTVMATSLGFIAAWLRLRSGSLWPAVLLHAAHNTLVQAVFTPMTTDTGHTAWYIDEFAAPLAVTALIGAIIVWRKRGDLPVSN